jgi:hypothetical protein
MDSARLRRRTIALIAAYALALQGLLLALVPAVPISPAVPFAALCAHDGGDGTGQGHPEPHDLPCAALCAALGHGVAGPTPSGLAGVAVIVQIAAMPAPIDDWAPPHRPFSGPQIPRGPPLA